jgi:AraC-like DNA-binding protein
MNYAACDQSILMHSGLLASGEVRCWGSLKLSADFDAIAESSAPHTGPLIALFKGKGNESANAQFATPNIASTIALYAPGQTQVPAPEHQADLYLRLDVETLSEVAEATVDGGMSGLQLRTGEGQKDPALAHLVGAVEAAVLSEAGSESAQPMARAIAARLIQSYSNGRQLLYPRQEAVTSVAPELRRAIGYLRDNIHRNVTLAELSRVANKSVSSLSRTFVAETGVAPHQYLIQLRVTKAKALLQTTDIPLIDVADLCGFSHVEHLARIFKRHTGTTPGAYRSRSQRRVLA